MSIAALACLAVTHNVAAKSGGGYHPIIDPANFQQTVDNPYLPLVPGTSFKLIEKEGKSTRENVVTVTRDKKVAMGVTCVVVHDTVTEKGKLLEDTFDWYAQDKDGNVWNFGEDTKEYKSRGRADTEGSWEAGVQKNMPGIMMPAHPQPGEPYRQEYGPGHAEDMGQVIAMNDSVAVPFGVFRECVRTKEWSLLEAGDEKKWYAKGIGLVRTQSSAGEVAELVSVTKQ